MSEEAGAIIVRLGVVGQNEAARAVHDFGNSAQHASQHAHRFGEAGEAMGEVFTKLGALAGHMSGELATVGSTLAKFVTGVHGASIAVAALGVAFTLLTVHASHVAAKLAEGATRAGTSIENYQGLKFAMEQSGSSAETMEKALSKISEAQGKAAETANDYGEMARKIKQHNEEMKDSAEQYAEVIRRIQENLSESQRSSALSTNEELRRLRESHEKESTRAAERAKTEAGRNPGRAAEIQADAHKRHLEREKDYEDRIRELKHQAALRQAEDQRKALIERQRAQEEHYRKQQIALRKFNEEMEKAADEAAKKLDKFTKYGINLFDGKGARDTIEVFKDVAKAIEAIENPAERSAKAVELFGRRIGTQLVEAMQEGGKGINKFIEEAKELGIILENDLVKAGKHAEDSFKKLQEVVSKTFERIMLAFAPLFGHLADAISEALGHNHKAIQEWANGIAKAIKPIFEDITHAIKGEWDKIDSTFIRVAAGGLVALGRALSALWGIAVQFGKGVAAAFDLAAKALDALGIHLGSGGDLAAFMITARALYPLLGMLARGFLTLASVAGGPWMIALRLIIAAMVFLLPLIQEHWPQIVAVFQAAAASIKAAWDSVTGWIASQFWGAVGAVESGLNSLWDWFASVYQKVKDGIKAVADWIKEKIDDALGWIKGLIQKAEEAANALGNLFGGGGGGGGGEQKYATGGHVSGPGGIDNVPARLTAGEFVMNTASVGKYGLGFMHAVNAQKFATGGLVNRMDGMAPPAPLHFASGGEVPAAGSGASSGATPVHLHIGGETYPVMADAHVANSLTRVAAGSQMRSAGPKPSWFGGAG